MAEQRESFHFDYKNVEHTAISIGVEYVPGLDEIISVHALPFAAEDKVVVVNVRSRGVDMAGGHIEDEDPTVLDALARELTEEANMTIKNPRLLDVLEVSSALIKEDDRKYIVIYTSDVEHLGDIRTDDEISDRLILSEEEFAEQYFAKAPNYITYLFALAAKQT